MIRKESDFEPDKEADTTQPPPKKRRRVPEACHVCRRRYIVHYSQKIADFSLGRRKYINLF